MLTHGTASVRQHMADDAQQYRNRMDQRVTRRTQAWGYVPVNISEDI
jgi:hypothetical protein